MPLSQSPGSDSLSWLVGTLNPRSLDGTIGHMWFDPDVRRFSTASQVQGFVGGPHAGEPVNHAQRPVLENSRSQVRDIARQAALLTLTCQRASESGAVRREMDIRAAMPLSPGQDEDASNDRMLSKMQRMARKNQERNGVRVRFAFKGNRDGWSA